MKQNKVKIGFEDKNYTGKEKSYSGNGTEYRIRIDSMEKLLLHNDNWQVKRTSDFDGMTDCVQQTNQDYRELEDFERQKMITEMKEYRYRADYNAEDDVLKIWDLALGTWELKNPDFGVVAE